MGIGQHPVTVTPMQVAAFFAMLANDGVMRRPHVVAREPETVGVVGLSGATRAALMRGMLGVCHEEGGTAYAAFNDPMRVGSRSFVGEFPDVTIAAKTGTAEHAGGEPHAWFAGFCPADDPRLAFAVIVEEGGPGGDAAAPLAAQMLYAYLKMYPFVPADREADVAPQTED